jgi:hypothetical protein
MSGSSAVPSSPEIAAPAQVRRPLALHRVAARELLAAAAAVPDERWEQSYTGEKWSPATIVEHLLITYEVVLAELRGGSGMKVRTTWWQRLLLRATVVPRILLTGKFPEGAPAPREVRPPESTRTRAEALALLEERDAEFEAAVAAASPRQRVTHAYFGASSVRIGVLIVARHIQHHAAQLRRAARGS